MKLSIATTLAALTSTTLAHGGVTAYTINGVTYPGYKWYDPPEIQSNLIQRTWHQNPHEDPLSPNITCNYHGTTVAGTYHAPLTAGDTITATWAHDGFGWVHTVGPLMVYMASCGEDCTTISDISELNWFKIAEEGLREGYAVGDNQGWFQNDLWENQVTDHWDVVVPKGLKKGKYMVRHEIINLELSPVQFYPNCAHLDIAGEGEEVPGDDYLVKFPGAYKVTDPGIAISGKIRQDKNLKNYTVPGPKVWSG